MELCRSGPLFSPSFLTANDRPGRYPDSYYAATAKPIAPFPEAQEPLRCDVCVIGGGFTGLSTALHLAERGLDVVLLEAHRMGWGASGRNGGQVGSGQRLGQDKLESWLGKEDATALWQIAEDAKDLVRTLILRHGIACDFKPGILHADHRQRFVKDSHDYAALLRDRYGYDQIRSLGRDEVRAMLGTTAYYGGTLDMGAGHLHPLNFALGLADAARRAGARLFEKAQVLGIEEGTPSRVRLGQADVEAEFVVLACNGYLDDLEPRVARRVMPINNFIIATEPLSEEIARNLIRDDVAVADSRFVINYYRLSADRRLLFGGGETYSYTFPADIKAFVRPYMLKIYPQLAEAKIDYGWGGTLAITAYRLPYFARLGLKYISVGGYSGHGVALSTMAGRIVADAIGGTAERMDLLSRLPVRPFPGGAHLRWPLLVLAMSYYALRDKL